MTGVLSTIQTNLPHLPKQPPFHAENGEKKSTINQLNTLFPATQITPPQFIQSDFIHANKISQVKLSEVVVIADKILQKIREKYQSPNSFQTSDNQLISVPNTADEKLLTKSQTFQTQPMPTLRFGNTGVSVRILQRLLASNGYGVPIDGFFGPLTETAVKAFQNQHHLLVDGIVGQGTWWRLTF
jgi:murein L,D-transpeptidase YcbB/YkuD